MRRILNLLAFAAASLIAATPEQDIQAVLEVQSAAWNRGDLDAFVKPYATETIFVGSEVERGDKQVLARYKRRYSTREKMGVLNYSGLEVKMLGPGYASVLGRFHLTRTAAGGGNADGVFTLLFHKTPQGWKVILDHTS